MSSTFNPTSAELALVNQIFAQGDPQNLGVLTGEVAVRIFGGAKLPPTVLGEIWNIADEDNKGWLSKRGVSIAVRLMGWVQKGEKVTPALINKPGPLATIDGVSVARHNTGASLPKSPPPGLPPLTPQDKVKFDNMFMKASPQSGLLGAEKVRDIFLKSNLANEQLLQIWNLADTKDRGALDSTDFAIGMYFIQGLMSGQLKSIPETLPPGLYQQASGNTSSSVTSHATGTSGSFSPLNATFSQNRPLQQQYTGQSQQLQPDYTGMSNQSRLPPRLPTRPSAPSHQVNGPTSQWVITPAEKNDYDRIFDTLDPQKKGYVEGEAAVPFMLQSNLFSEDLALIWDLADMNNDGRLTREGFAVALYLMQKKLAGQTVPKTLPPSLLSAIRSTSPSPFSPKVSIFQPAPEPQVDLLWDETPPPSTTTPQPTSSSTFAPIAPNQTGSQRSPFASTPSHQASTDPFGASPFAPPPTSHKDLLGDDDDGTTSPSLHDQSAEIGNVQNQISSTNRSLETAKRERTTLEQTVSNQSAELGSMQSQLAALKASYDHETRLLQSLQERFTAQSQEIQKAKEELIRAESDLSAVRLEKAELEGNILRDKEEARALHRKMVEASQSIETIKADIEKAKKDAKQQKGLLAIARKQLSTKEAEKVKVVKEHENAEVELTGVNKELQEVEAELAKPVEAPMPTSPPERAMSTDTVTFASAYALPATPDPSSPGPKSNNPFERLAMSSMSSSSPSSQMPFSPFANAAIPTPTTAPGATETGLAAPQSSNDDPFGFKQDFNDDEPMGSPIITQSDSPETSHTHSTPASETATSTTPTTLKAIPAASSPASSNAVSPTTESEHFATPPTSASGPSQGTGSPPTSVDGATPRSSTLDEVSSKFPPLNTSLPEHVPIAQEHHEPTDLNHQPMDLDVNESDSDSDSEDDKVPLAELAKARTRIDKPAQTQPAPITNGTASSTGPNASFDDVFGVPEPVAVSTVPVQTRTPTMTTDAFGAPISKSTDPFGAAFATPSAPAASPPQATGVAAFDVAMGQISPTATTAKPQFSFGTAFEDNFDFAAAAEKSNETQSTTLNGNAPSSSKTLNFDAAFSIPTVSNGVPPAQAPAPAIKPSFDDIFATDIKPPLNQSTTTTTSAQSQIKPSSTSFDDTFANFTPTPSLDLDSSFTSTSTTSGPAPKPMAPTPSHTDSPTQPQKPFPTTSPPNSPARGGPSPSSVRGVSPQPRHRSPPPRITSPKPRPSTSSSKDGNEKPKDPPHRHSKLSIRLPFGKKKKHEAPPPPPPSQFLTPPVEEPSRIGTPALDDDVQPVKQLCGMGFSRTEAIAALEKHSYDLPRALNSLLGSQ